MGARFLFRLDDACPQMHESRWARMEEMLDGYSIKPIVAVIPQNKSAALTFRAPDPNFWARVRRWAAKGWAIALHGYDHVYVTNEGGLVPLNRKSEFAGLHYQAQKTKLRAAWKIFLENGVTPTVWVAPAHSFDENTLKALAAVTEIRIVSDGLALNPYQEFGFNWIPQQLWTLKGWLPLGTWTICLHPNTCSEPDFVLLQQSIEKNRRRIVRLEDITLGHNRKGLADHLLTAYFGMKVQRAHVRGTKL